MPGKTPGRGARKRAPAVAMPLHWQGARLLVVDDQRTYRLLMSSLLHRLGLAHDAVADGRMALRALNAQRYDMVITDCRMPVMDGYTLARELRCREARTGTPHIPVLALTGCLGPDEVRRCVDCGMDGWLIKPVVLEQLREVLLYWLPAPQSRPRGGWREPVPAAVQERVPTRSSLIATFGSWAVVQPLLSCLLQEAREDLAVLSLARSRLDATLTTQRLHRLVGSIAFFGATILEQRAVHLIAQVNQSGVATQLTGLEQFHRDVEQYLECLAAL